MTQPDRSGEPAEPGESKTDRRQDRSRAHVMAAVARVARALAGAPADADDAALLALLSPAVVPSLGDVVALYSVGESGEAALVASVPPGALPGHGRPADYATIVMQGRPVVIRRPATAPTLASELAAPVEGGSGRDAVLVFGSTDPDHRLGEADLETVETLASLLGSHRAVRALSRRAAELHRLLDENIQAGRELAHSLNNDLTMPVGVVELLLDRDTLPADLREMLEAARTDLAALEGHVRVFHETLRTRFGAPTGVRQPGQPGPGYRPPR